MKLLNSLLLAACVAALPMIPAQAQTFPTKPVTLVVPFPPGGPTDAMARTLAAEMKDSLGQPVIVENRAGAGGNIGAEYVARSAPDGQTLLFGTSGPLAINSSLYRKIGYDQAKSFAPIIQIGHLPNILVVNPAVPAKNVQELIAYSKSNPGKLSYASSGNGASSHLAGVMFNSIAGTDFQHVPYKGTGPALNDLLGGQVSMSFTDVLTALPYVKAGKLRALGVTTATRSQALPDVPTLAEQGIKGYDVSVFFGIVAPAGTPPAIIGKLNGVINETLKAADMRELLTKFGSQPRIGSPQDFATFLAGETRRWADVAKAANVSVD
jgi:tripartite-type tricarboxylate transporter receptor subunit TctC